MKTVAKIALLVATLFGVGFFIHLGIAFYSVCCSIKAIERSEIILEGRDRLPLEEMFPTQPNRNSASRRFERGILAIWNCSFLEPWEQVWMSWALLYYPYGVITGKGGREATEEEREHIFKFLEEEIRLGFEEIEWIRAHLKPENCKPFKERIHELAMLRKNLSNLKKQVWQAIERKSEIEKENSEVEHSILGQQVEELIEEINTLQQEIIEFDELISLCDSSMKEFENRRARLLKIKNFYREVIAYRKEDRAIVCAIFMFQRGWWSSLPEDQERCEKILTQFQENELLTPEDCEIVRSELERCENLTWAQFQEEDPNRYKYCLEKLDLAWRRRLGGLQPIKKGR